MVDQHLPPEPLTREFQTMDDHLKVMVSLINFSNATFGLIGMNEKNLSRE
jgi:hypothetical protein